MKSLAIPPGFLVTLCKDEVCPTTIDETNFDRSMTLAGPIHSHDLIEVKGLIKSTEVKTYNEVGI